MHNALRAEKSEIHLDGHHLSTDEVYRVSTVWEGARLALAEDAILRMKKSLQVKEDLIASGIPIYGVTTGFGDNSSRQISPEKTVALQRNLLRFLRVGTGPVAPDEIIRATMLIRANCALEDTPPSGRSPSTSSWRCCTTTSCRRSPRGGRWAPAAIWRR